MGKNIRGWVEVREEFKGVNAPIIKWYGVISIGFLLGRNYDMFGSLFGAAYASAQFQPIATNRGLPPDISEQASDDYLTWDSVMGESWISWQEVQQIDWDEQAVDKRPRKYEADALGQMVYVGKSSDPLPTDMVEEGNSWQVGSILFKIERVSRRESLTRDWQLLFRLMGELAAEYGSDNIRLVVWFDY